MILGMSTSTFTMLHVIISLVGILSGVIVVFRMLSAARLSTCTALFLITTVATSVTGFMLPSPGFDAAHVVGVISLVVLAIAILALYVYNLAGAWSSLYVVSSVIALYLNVFVSVVQSFQKIYFLHTLAPNGSEPPFIIAQVLVMAILIVLGISAVTKFHPVRQVLA
jgi:hypothetical protein